MLEKPDLTDEEIIACLQAEYGLQITHFAFLPLGADLRTAVYRAVAADGTPYFCKLRRGAFDETTVELPKFLSAQGITQIIPPLETQTGQLRASLNEFKVILNPFVEGKTAYEVALSDSQWADFGAALKKIHTIVLPPRLAQQIKQETYSPYWLDRVAHFMALVAADTFNDPVSIETAAVLNSHRAEIISLADRAALLAQSLQARSPKFVLCHADIHPGNLLISPDDSIYIVDWDDPMLAPQERDLMFIGGGQGFPGCTAQQEQELFYRGYGEPQIDLGALAYYRCERVITDIAVNCEIIYVSPPDNPDRARELEFLKYAFLPGGTIEMARRSEN